MEMIETIVEKIINHKNKKTLPLNSVNGKVFLFDIIEPPIVLVGEVWEFEILRVIDLKKKDKWGQNLMDLWFKEDVF